MEEVRIKTEEGVTCEKINSGMLYCASRYHPRSSVLVSPVVAHDDYANKDQDILMATVSHCVVLHGSVTSRLMKIF